MKKSKFAEERFAFALKRPGAELGTLVEELIRNMGITEKTSYRSKKKCGGLGASELWRLRQKRKTRG